jgi:hypothetical protein
LGRRAHQLSLFEDAPAAAPKPRTPGAEIVDVPPDRSQQLQAAIDELHARFGAQSIQAGKIKKTPNR